MRINELKIFQDARASVDGVADGLVLNDLITAANEVLRVATEAEQTAVASMTKAEADLKAAKAAEEKAVHSGGDVMTATMALEQAERLARVALRVLHGATTNRTNADAALARATGEAWRPVAVEGAQRLVDACAKVEEAREMLNTAFVEVRAGEALLVAAKGKGTQFRSDHAKDFNRWLVDGNGDICLHSAAQERQSWITAGLLSEEPKVEAN